MSVRTVNGVPVLEQSATYEDLRDVVEFYFPTDDTRPPRQPATKFCQVDEQTMQTLLAYAMSWATEMDRPRVPRTDEKPQRLRKREERAAELMKIVKVGSRLFVSAQFTNTGHIVVDEVTPTGVRCGGEWFGWHEITSVDEP